MNPDYARRSFDNEQRRRMRSRSKTHGQSTTDLGSLGANEDVPQRTYVKEHGSPVSPSSPSSGLATPSPDELSLSRMERHSTSDETGADGEVLVNMASNEKQSRESVDTSGRKEPDNTSQLIDETSDDESDDGASVSREWLVHALLHKVDKMYYSYFWRHFAVFVVIALVSSGVYFGASKGHISYIDALYIATSALTCTGLSPIDFSTVPVGAQVIVFLLTNIGGSVSESAYPLIIRLARAKYYGGTPRSNFAAQEQKAMWLLLRIITLYWVSLYLICWIPVALWFQFSKDGRASMHESNVNAWWFSLFETGMAVNNAGFSILVTGSFIPINLQAVPLVFFGLTSLSGNVMYPILLRGLVQLHLVYYKLRGNKERCETVKFILENPRQISTHLFTKYDTAVLTVCVMSLVWLCTFLVMATEWGNESVFGEGMGGGYMFLNCFFTSVVTRTTGFNSVNISGMSTASLIQILLHMYLAHYPFIVVMRRSNNDLDWKRGGKLKKRSKFQARSIMLWDMACLMLPWYLVAVAQSYQFGNFAFAIIFDLVSAYATVGLSLGTGYDAASFSGSWNVGGKLLIIFVMFMGKHRSMPNTIDAALHDKFE